MIVPELHSIRQEYIKEKLNEENVNSDPIQQFVRWMDHALLSKVMEPSAMTVATVNQLGQPSARTVLLKNITDKGFVFYTNYNSQKGQDLAENNRVSLLFFWPELERQVRIEGKVEKISREESEIYFHSRPFGSQIGAIASPQSEVIENRDMLKNKVEELELSYKDKVVPMPEHWGGYLVNPHKIEFWQGGASRLHDRLVYTATNLGWKIQRLAP
jgi:pyridoxamine 5'-phosphate oxidase